MKPLVFVMGLMLCAVALGPTLAQTSSEPLSVDECLKTARSSATDLFTKHASPEAARLQLEIDAATCFDPSLSPGAAHLIGTVNADRARFARDFVVGSRSLAAYRAVREDRRRKLARLLADPNAQETLLKGDSDGDLVADDSDQCPNTASGAPTDERGCPDSISLDTKDHRDERELRRVLTRSQTLYNPSCERAPRLAISSPLEWGRGRQTKSHTQGFNLAVAKVDNQPPGCEVFYEIQFRFIEPNPGNPALPPTKIVTIAFSQSEDLLADPKRAIFGIPVGEMPLSPARSVAREAFLRQYFRASWRVRVVNGANKTSPWSSFITQGPASGGVDG